MASQAKSVDYEVVAHRKTVKRDTASIVMGPSRAQTKNLDVFPLIDRSLIDYDRYHKYIGHAGVKYSMAIQATRGCPYKCFYCDIYKTSVIHYRRSVEHFFNEVKMLADIGVKRFEFIDDIFNVNKKDCIAFFEQVLKHNLDVKFFFPTGLKGDLLDKDMIDLMIEAGSLGLNLSLEHAAPRMQEVMRKGLDVDILHENLQYISAKYPHVTLTLNAMHGFPTETEEEALLTLNYIKSIKWLDFPYLHNVRIFPGTELEHFALEVGIPREEIELSQDMSYHESSPTLPFSRKFTASVRTVFLKEYVLNRERLLHILPYQLAQYSEDELDQKYNSYFPNPKIKTVNDLLKFVKIDRSELKLDKTFDEKSVRIPELKTRVREIFPVQKPKDKDALRLMLIDLSSYFSDDFDSREYNVLEPPLGLMALLTYINQEFGEKVDGGIYKSRIDFDSYEELLQLVKEFKPDMIGVRAMTFYKGFFHDSIDYLRKHGVDVPIIVGGPYPTASYADVLEDKNIDLAVVAEGEITLKEILTKTIANNKTFPGHEVLREIPGVAFYGQESTDSRESRLRILSADASEELPKAP